MEIYGCPFYLSLFSRGLEHDLHLHKPHPENIIKGGALKAVKLHLKQEGYL